MKQFDNTDLEEEIEINVEQEQKNNVVFLGSRLKTPGHILWEYNLATKELNPASYAKTTFTVTTFNRRVNMERLLKLNNRVDIRQGCVYLQALNRSNAIKKLEKHYA